MPSTPASAVSVILGVHSWEWEECPEATVRGWDAPGPGPALPSDLASPCPTGREVFLRRRLGARGQTPAIRLGSELHSEALGVWRAAVEGGLEGLLEAARGVATPAGLWAVASAYTWLRDYRGLLPVSVEPRLPGWAGYAGGRPDLVVGPYPVELVSGQPGGRGFEAKRLALAAYILMLERLTGAPLDHGYIVSLREGRAYPACIGDQERLEAIRRAQWVALALSSDPGLPESPAQCPSTCPFRVHCWGGGVEAPRSEARVESRAEEGAG